MSCEGSKTCIKGPEATNPASSTDAHTQKYNLRTQVQHGTQVSSLRLYTLRNIFAKGLVRIFKTTTVQQIIKQSSLPLAKASFHFPRPGNQVLALCHLGPCPELGCAVFLLANAHGKAQENPAGLGASTAHIQPMQEQGCRTQISQLWPNVRARGQALQCWRLDHTMLHAPTLQSKRL